MASGTDSEDPVRILKDIRDEIRNARNELRDEIRGVRTERVDRPDSGRRMRAALVTFGAGVALLVAAMIFWRVGGSDGGKTGAPKVGGEIVAVGSPTSMPDPPLPAPPRSVMAAPAPIVATPASVAVAPPLAAAVAPKRVPVHHRARQPTEAELEEPAKL